MKNNNLLNELHIGCMVKDIANRRSVTSKQVADTIKRDNLNRDKIYKLDDMDVSDCVKISYLLGHNLLEDICKKYLQHLTYTKKKKEHAYLKFTMDMRTGCITHYINPPNCDYTL